MYSVIVREASLDDEPAVQTLCERNGLERERSDSAWRWIWEGNKYYNDDWPLGWVLESNGEVVGFIGNIPRPYTFQGKLWIAGVARSLAVDREFRSYTLKLIATFFKKNQLKIGWKELEKAMASIELFMAFLLMLTLLGWFHYTTLTTSIATRCLEYT